jgi:hypothetical protein
MRLKLVPVALLSLILLVAPIFAQAQSADLTGSIRDVSFNLPAVKFTFLDDQNAKWDCKGGTPDDMEAGGWNKNSMRGAGTVKIQTIPIKPGQISIQAVKNADGRPLLPKPPIKKTAPAVVCTREPVSRQ